MKAAILAIVLVLTACGNAPTSQVRGSGQPSPELTRTAVTSPSPKPKPTTPPKATPPALDRQLLFAVVEYDSEYNLSAPDTVAIVGLDGYARAKAHFQKRGEPTTNSYYIPLQSAAQVIGSRVYFIDGVGTVRLLQVGKPTTVVASFPQQNVQEDTWFAVSPDGSRVLAGTFTLPAIASDGKLVGPWKFDLASAPAGGPSTNLVHFEYPLGSTGPKPIFPVGWTSAGSVATLPVALTINPQNAWYGGPLYVYDGLGNRGARVGGPGCYAAAISPSGLVVCATGAAPVTIRDQAGNVVWTARIGGDAQSLSISPNGQAIANPGQVQKRGGPVISIGAIYHRPVPDFFIEGWLDNNTVIGRIIIDDAHVGNLAWLSLSSPTVIHDLGFQGDFVATLGKS